MPLLSLALAIMSAGPQAVEQNSAQRAAEQVSACGLGPVTSYYDRDLHEDILVARAAADVTDSQLDCAYNIAGVEFSLVLPPEIQSRYDALANEKASFVLKAEAHDWLAAHNLDSRIPKYEPGVTDDRTFVQQIEALCGPHAQGAFQRKYGFHAISPEWNVNHVGTKDSPEGEAFSCIMMLAIYSGYKIGFIGNEAFPPRH